MEKPDLSKTDFWKYQLDVSATNALSDLKINKESVEKLKAIVDYCADNNIIIKFFAPPTHQSLQNKIDELKLSAQKKEYIEILSGLATFQDFDIKSEITTDALKFSDPYHINHEYSELIVKELVNETEHYSKIYTNNKSSH